MQVKTAASGPSILCVDPDPDPEFFSQFHSEDTKGLVRFLTAESREMEVAVVDGPVTILDASGGQAEIVKVRFTGSSGIEDEGWIFYSAIK
jgi:hypothetical protein